MELKQKQILITIWILGNPECLRSMADRFNITKSILVRFYRRICGATVNNLSGQHEVPTCLKMIDVRSVTQRNALDQ